MKKNEKRLTNLMEITQPRNKILDIYKGVLIVLVVMRHVLQYSVIDEGGFLTNFIWAVQMPGFMMVAGYFAARKIGSTNDVGRRILFSAQHYALPFFSWFVLIQVLLLGGHGRNPIEGLIYLAYHVDHGLWFLWVIFVLSTIATILNYGFSSTKGKAVKTLTSLISCFGTLLVIGKFFGINFLGIKFIVYYFVFYGFGWLVKWTEPWWKQCWSKIKDTAIFVCLVVFCAIVFKFDLYHADDNVLSIMIRCIAGFTGNAVLLTVCEKHEEVLNKAMLDKLGMYTLEIYASHMFVNNLTKMGQEFFTAEGFGNFVCSLILTVVLTTVIIATFTAIPAADFLFYGKRRQPLNSKANIK